MLIYLVEQNTVGMEKDFKQYMTEAVIVAADATTAKAATVDVCAAFGHHIDVEKLTVTEVGPYTGRLPDNRFRWSSKYGKTLAIGIGE